ncbi:MAG: hypothetical protein VCE75_09880 [Alphaproteobacteria bacterium]
MDHFHCVDPVGQMTQATITHQSGIRCAVAAAARDHGHDAAAALAPLIIAGPNKGLGKGPRALGAHQTDRQIFLHRRIREQIRQSRQVGLGKTPEQKARCKDPYSHQGKRLTHFAPFYDELSKFNTISLPILSALSKVFRQIEMIDAAAMLWRRYAIWESVLAGMRY